MGRGGEGETRRGGDGETSWIEIDNSYLSLSFIKNIVSCIFVTITVLLLPLHLFG
ncbi:MAG: hypothetical protein F6K58_05685 [Symploca sp. SIO2E9]|nr:hypothetical protein [Symploca sp. SIO2E9]